MGTFPKDCKGRVIGSTAKGIFHYQLPKKHWEYHESIGADSGTDCVIELIENEEFHNQKIECQIKGTTKAEKLKNKPVFSFPLDVKTINYALSSSTGFVLFYVDINNEIIYYLPIQDYFISNKELYDKLNGKQEKLSVHIPADNILSEDDFDLQQIAKSIYIDGPSKNLYRIQGS